MLASFETLLLRSNNGRGCIIPCRRDGRVSTNPRQGPFSNNLLSRDLDHYAGYTSIHPEEIAKHANRKS